MVAKKTEKIVEKIATTPKLQGKLERLLKFRPTTQEWDGIKQQFQDNMEEDGGLFIIRLQEYDVLIGKAGDVQSYVDRNTETTSLYDRMEKDNNDLHFRIQSQECSLHNLRAALKDSISNVNYLNETNKELVKDYQELKTWNIVLAVTSVLSILGALYLGFQ